MLKKIIAFSFLLFVSFLSFAQNKDFKTMKDTSSFKTKLEEKAKLTNTIESNFTQEKNLSMLSEKIISKGHFCFKKTNLLRWEYLLSVFNINFLFVYHDEISSRREVFPA